jgi:hypothetical protein
MEKVMTKVTPRGYLHDTLGNHYYLLGVHPVEWDNWTGDRQAWQVIKAGYNFDEDGCTDDFKPVGGRMTAIVSNQSTVEFCTIEPFEITEYDWAEQSMSIEEMEDEERQQLRFENIFAEG